MNRLHAVAAALLLSPALAAAQAPKVTVNGTVDSYFTLNLDHGQGVTSPTGGVTALSGFNFNYAKIGTVAEAGPATLKLDLAYGPSGQAATGFDPRFGPGGTTSRIFVQQALVALRFEKVTVEAGRFVSPAGFEVIEAKDNWLYSHGLLFNFAKPLALEGVRVFFPASPELTLTAGLANGSDLYSNDLGFNATPYKTLILGGVYAKESHQAKLHLFVSKDPVTADDVFLLDGVYTRAMGPTAFNVSADFGQQGSSSWLGLGASIKHALAPDGLRIVGRLEYLDDQDGIHTLPAFGAPALAPAPTVLSLTGGVNYPVGSNAELRAELRLDQASEKYYDGESTAVTFTAAAIAWF